MTFSDDLKRDAPLYYASTLFAPADKRAALATLYAFDHEIKRIPTMVSEPTLGAIRLQWWREALNGERTGEAKLHPLASAIIDLMQDNLLPLQGLLHLIDGEAISLEQASHTDQRALENDYGLRYAALFQLACVILDHRLAHQCTDASGHAGMAFGVARDVVTGGHAVARDDLIGLGEFHLQAARAMLVNLPDAIRPAFLPLVIVAPVLDMAKRANTDRMIGVPSYLAILWRMLRFKI